MPEQFHGGAPLAIIIMGVCGCGKTTVGVELANAIACSFFEGDKFHTPQAIAKMRAGTPLTDQDRWPWLDGLGRAIASEVADGRMAVAACSALKRIYRDRLRQTIGTSVRFVLLDGQREELLQRLLSRTGHYMPASLLSSQLEILERPASDETAITVDASKPPAILCGEIIDWLASGSQAQSRIA